MKLSSSFFHKYLAVILTLHILDYLLSQILYRMGNIEANPLLLWSMSEPLYSILAFAITTAVLVGLSYVMYRVKCIICLLVFLAIKLYFVVNCILVLLLGQHILFY